MKKNKIIVAVCSRKFNRNLLNLMNKIYLNSTSFKLNLEVLITFNNSNKINKKQLLLIVKSLKKITFNIIYEDKIGISHVRNKSLNYLRKTNFNYYCFIDDDCSINNDFIFNHLRFIKKNKCSIVTGPQIYKSKKIFFRIFERNYLQGQKIFWASTNNVFFKNNILKKKLYFSLDVSKYGFGEDQLYFSKLSKLGKVIKWNNNPVFEVIQKKRENLLWFIERNYKYGLTGFLIERELYGSFIAFFMNLLKAIFYFIRMVSNLVFLLSNPKKNFYNIVSNFFRFLGRMSGSINIIK